MKVPDYLVKESVGVLFCTILYFLIGDINNLYIAILCLITTLYIIIRSTLLNLKNQNLVSFINIANLFAFFIFVARPVHIFMNRDNLDSFVLLYVKNFYSGYDNLFSLPIAQAAYIGMLGVFALNIYVPYQRRLAFSHVENSSLSKSTKFSKGEISGLILFTTYALVSALVNVAKTRGFLSTDLRIFDMIWIFLFSSITTYIICVKRTPTVFVYFLLIISIIITSLTARRQFIVNLLLCYTVALYYASRDRRKQFIRVLLAGVAIFAVVTLFSLIRSSGYTLLGKSFTSGLMDEFSMYEMLLISLKFKSRNSFAFLYGYNYLTLFSMVLPGISIEHFDHMLTRVVFSNALGGGNPISIFGSLYFNFSYIGVFTGALILGGVFTKVQNKLAKKSNNYIEAIGYYACFSTFVYDIMRVGNIGREVWIYIALLLVFITFIKVMRILAPERFRSLVNK